MEKARRRRRSKTSQHDSSALNLKFVPLGPTMKEVQSIAQAVTKHRAVQAYLAKARYRLLRIDLLDPSEEPKPARPVPPDRFRAVFFDYTNNRSVIATGALAKPRNLEVVESGFQPRPTQEEFDEAVR